MLGDGVTGPDRMSITSGDTPPDGLARARLSNRLAVAFVLDVVSLARAGGHLLDTLLLSSIVQANLALISRYTDLQVAYADLASPPPDELRRPVSINATANSLRLPFETVRRRLRNLAAQDRCRFVEGGVIVPQSALASPTYVTNAFAVYERLRAFYYEMRDRQLLDALSPLTTAYEGRIPVRAVARLTSDYVLRVVDPLVALAGGLLNGVLLLEVFRGNVEHLGPDAPERRALAPGEPLPDRLRRPVRLGVLADRVGLPTETTRRHLADLIRRGLVAKVQNEFITPGTALASPGVSRFMDVNLANVQRLFAGLSQLGVLAFWDGLPPSSAREQIPQNE